MVMSHDVSQIVFVDVNYEPDRTPIHLQYCFHLAAPPTNVAWCIVQQPVTLEALGPALQIDTSKLRTDPMSPNHDMIQWQLNINFINLIQLSISKCVRTTSHRGG